MDTVQQLERRRDAVLEQMRSVRSMRHGTINEQYFASSAKGSTSGAMRGPYYVLSRNESGKTISQRLPAEQVERARADVAAHKRFVALCREFERLTEQLGQVERSGEVGQEKERRR